MSNEVISVCLKCGHSIKNHTIKIIGRYDFMEITCDIGEDNYEDKVCGCDAGFNKVQIKKEFSTMRDK